MRPACLVFGLATLAGACSNDIGIAPNDKGPGDVVTDDTDLGVGFCSTEYAPHATTTLDGCSGFEIGAFEPWVEWSAIPGKGSTALPVVADLDGDDRPEVLVNVTGLLSLSGPGALWVLNGDGSFKWKNTGVKLGYGAAFAVGDVLGDDKVPEIVTIQGTGLMLPTASPKYYVVLLDNTGVELWRSEAFTKRDFDYATAPILSDMDHDGRVEIVAGRVILADDGTTRAVGTHGHGSWGELVPASVSEGAVSAVADIDLDGVEEVIVGDAVYNLDGTDKWFNDGRHDGMVAVANVDDDPEAEWFVSSYGSIRAHDTDGSLIWGPNDLLCVVGDCYDSGEDTSQPKNANILSVPTVADIDGDGKVEVIVAGGSQVAAFNGEDGSQLWANVVHDVSGATGASVFDFDADGVMEVVYIDEVAMYAFDGRDGTTVFQSDKHASPTMMDYPVIVDVDADNSAEIVVAHFGFSHAISVYGAADGVWAPTRRVWNQHAYTVGNIDDDLTIPVTPVPGFTSPNTYHAASPVQLPGQVDRPDLQAEIVDVCEAACDSGTLQVGVQVINRSATVTTDPGVSVSLYAQQGATSTLVATLQTTGATDPATYGELLTFDVPAELAARASKLEVVVDDDGSGSHGTIAECVEDDNAFTLRGPFCQ